MRRIVPGAVVVLTLTCFPLSGAALGAPPETSRATGTLEDVSCPSSTQCYAAGRDDTVGGGVGVVDTLQNGQQTRSLTAGFAQGFGSISCPTTGFCGLVGYSGSVETLANGKFGPIQKLALDAVRISCLKPERCLLVGHGRTAADRNLIEAAVLAGGKLGPIHKATLPDGLDEPYQVRLSCASSSSCEFAGLALQFGNTVSYYGAIGAGGRIHAVHALTHNYVLEDIACQPSGAECYIAADSGGPTPILSVAIGGGALSLVSTPTISVSGLACSTLAHCTLIGDGQSGAAVQTLSAGQPGNVRSLPSLNDTEGLTGVAQTTATRFVAVASDAGPNQVDVVSGSDP